MRNLRTTSQRPAATVHQAPPPRPRVSTRVTSRGATAIFLRGKELAHVHLDRATLDKPVGDERRARILEEGRAKKWFSGWVSKRITSDADAADGLALLRESYDEQRTRGVPATPAAN